MTYTDNQLKQALAKMLPDVLNYKSILGFDNQLVYVSLWWLKEESPTNRSNKVLDTELLHICWLIEQSIPSSAFSTALMHVIQDETCWPAVESRYATASAPWQQRTIALAKVKGVEIV